MSSEFHETAQPPAGPAEQFRYATTRIAELHVELQRKKLGDEFLQKYRGRLALEAFALTAMESLRDEQLRELGTDFFREWEEYVREQTFERMEKGDITDPWEAESAVSVEGLMDALVGDEDDQRHFAAVTEINDVIIGAFGTEGIHIPPSIYTWRLEMLGGISPNQLTLVTNEFEPGLSLAMESDEDEIVMRPFRQLENLHKAVTGQTQRNPLECLSDTDRMTLPYIAEEVIFRLHERVVPALETELAA